MDRLLVSSPLNPKPSSPVTSMSMVLSPALTATGKNYLGDCGHFEQFWDSQKILRNGESHGRNEHTHKYLRDNSFMFFFGSAHIVWKFFVFVSLKRVELLCFQRICHSELCYLLAWGKRDRLWWLDHSFRRNCSFPPSSLAYVLWVLGEPWSLRLLVPCRKNNYGSSSCWPSSSHVTKLRFSSSNPGTHHQSH